MSAIPDHAEIYRKLHETRYEHVEQARRARDYQYWFEASQDMLTERESKIWELSVQLGLETNAQSRT